MGRQTVGELRLPEVSPQPFAGRLMGRQTVGELRPLRERQLTVAI